MLPNQEMEPTGPRPACARAAASAVVTAKEALFVCGGRVARGLFPIRWAIHLQLFSRALPASSPCTSRRLMRVPLGGLSNVG